MNVKTKRMLASYGRAMLAAVITLAATGNTDPKDLLKAALAALLPVALRWLNPKDAGYGRYTVTKT